MSNAENLSASVDWHEQRFRATLLTSAGLKRLPPPEPLVDGLLQLDSLAELYGRSGLGKTFVAVSMACCVATGRPWMGHDVTQGRVLYVVAENASGTGQRVDAWEEYHRTQVPAEALTWLTLAVNLGQPDEVAAFAKVAQDCEPRLIVFDTRARCTVGVEENSARDMGQVVAATDELRRLTGACVLTVHHPSATGEKARGSTAYLGAIDSELKLEKAGDGMRLVVPKQRNAPDDTKVTMRLEPFARSAVVVPADPVKVEGSWDDLILVQLGELCRGDEVAYRGAWYEAVCEAAEQAGRDTPSDSSFKRAIARLIEDAEIVKAGRGQYRPAPGADVVSLSEHRGDVTQ